MLPDMEEATEKFQTKKSLGQHFLNNPSVSRWMCDAAEITSKDKVVEVGPGTGALTSELLARGATVIALEADIRAIAHLETAFDAEIASGQLTCLHHDVRQLNVADIPGISDHQFKLVANIPYYLSGLLFRIFLQSPVQPSLLVYLVQKEVAKRITTDVSRGEKESLLSLAVKVYGEAEYVRMVPRGHFTPAPKVDSAILAVRNISRTAFKDLDEAQFFKVLHLAFGQKRKQLVGNLAKEFDRATVTHILSTMNLSVSTRAEDVPAQMWPTLVAKLLSTDNPSITPDLSSN